MALDWRQFENAMNPNRRCRRGHDRVVLRNLACDLGPIIDLSTSGMRVLARRSLSGAHAAHIAADGDDQLDLYVVVAWSRRLGFRRHVLGLKIVDAGEEQARAIERLIEAHRLAWPDTG